MALVKWTPGKELETLRHEMGRLFEGAFPKVFGEEWEIGHGWRPEVDIRETDEAYVIETDLPGVAAEEVTVEVEGPYVVLKGERHTEHEATEKGVKRTERAYGKFYRRVALPEAAKVDEAEARYVNGVLTVTVPKTEEAKAKAITVEAA